MRVVADLHIHSRYSRACSKDLTLPNLEKWARVKGLDLLGTGDFTHPAWRKELDALTGKDGVYRSKKGFPFLLQTEISLIYTQGRGRKVHLLVYAPSLGVVDRITEYLLRHGRVDYDGRPIFRIPCRDFVRDLRAVDDRVEVVPAHAWTPWFSVLGSKGGFDSLAEAFGDQLAHVHALETGISSDIGMNDSVSQLNNLRFVSFSDAHSYWPWRLGREATVFELEELTYDAVLAAIRTGAGLASTIECPPPYGKYHVDGHRACGVSLEPGAHDGSCPACGKPLTIGVLSRVRALADQSREPSQASVTLIPLHEVLSFVLGRGVNTKTVWTAYDRLLAGAEHEFDVLLTKDRGYLEAHGSAAIADAVLAMRAGDMAVTPGYDGVYGVPRFGGTQ